MLAIVLLRRELRLMDNTAILRAVELGYQVALVFIFTPEQISTKNRFRSSKAIQFMCETLLELEEDIKFRGSVLNCFYGEQSEIVARLVKTGGIDAVFYNIDYTKYALERDARIRAAVPTVCEGVEDSLLLQIGTVRNGLGEYYQKFTPFYNRTAEFKVRKPAGFNGKLNEKLLFGASSVAECITWLKLDMKSVVLRKGGRTMGLKLLSDAQKIAARYGKIHDELAGHTTELSAYIKFGVLSVREVYWKLYKYKDFIRQLWWREFYYNIGAGFPWVYENRALKKQYDSIKWSNKADWLRAWQRGETGFPIVDAGMRQLNQTGYMHNRARLITSGFLVKILLIDWREGEKYYSRQLYDIDRAVNNGNWQWTAGCGADSQPYFRILNPWRQSKRFDPDAEYIKRWVPELTDVPANDIHNWDVKGDPAVYLIPIVDYKERRNLVLKEYHRALK